MRRLVAAALFLLSVTATVFAVQPDEILKDPALEARARSLSAGLRCLVCQNQSIDDSDAPLARDLRLLIRERLTAGDSDDAVIDFIVGRYGQFVLLKPRLETETLLLWAGPFALLLLAALFLWLHRRSAPGAGAEAPLNREESAALDRLLEYQYLLAKSPDNRYPAPPFRPDGASPEGLPWDAHNKGRTLG
jgi:cytochrome c-type biogenesis protein CcmH